MTEIPLRASVSEGPRRFRTSLWMLMALVLVVGTAVGLLVLSRRNTVELQTIRSELALAQAELQRATARAAWSDRMFQKGYVSKAQVESERLAVQKSVFTLEQVKARQKLLETWFGP